MDAGFQDQGFAAQVAQLLKTGNHTTVSGVFNTQSVGLPGDQPDDSFSRQFSEPIPTEEGQEIKGRLADGNYNTVQGVFDPCDGSGEKGVEPPEPMATRQPITIMA